MVARKPAFAEGPPDDLEVAWFLEMCARGWSIIDLAARVGRTRCELLDAVAHGGAVVTSEAECERAAIIQQAVLSGEPPDKVAALARANTAYVVEVASQSPDFAGWPDAAHPKGRAA